MRRLPVTGTGVGLAVLAALSYALGFALGYPVLVALATGAIAILLAAGCFVTIRPSVQLTRQVTPDRTTVGSPRWAACTYATPPGGRASRSPPSTGSAPRPSPWTYARSRPAACAR